MNKTVALIAIFLSCMATSQAGPVLTLNEESLPPEFKATYDIQKGGMHIGEMQVSLRKIGDQLIYESVTNPTNLATLFLGTQMTDRAVLRRINKDYRISEFKREVQGSTKNRHEHYVFDWDSNKASVRYKDRSDTLDIPSYTFDNFSVQLLLMRRPDDKNTENRFSVISKGRLKEYVYKPVPGELLETKLGRLLTNKYIREKNNEKKTTYLGWYAESLHYIPVKLDKVENGKVDVSIQITAITWL